MAIADDITGTSLHAIVEGERDPSDRLYGIVDAARDRQLAFDASLRFGWRLQWLFGEDTAHQMRDVAPYLVPIEFNSAYLDLWAERIGSSVGILLLAGAQPDELRAHLATLFESVDERGGEFFFRFYDPRVLRVFLPTCSAAHATKFFGPIRRIIVEAEEPNGILVYSPNSEGVNVEERSLRRS